MLCIERIKMMVLLLFYTIIGVYYDGKVFLIVIQTLLLLFIKRQSICSTMIR